MTASPRERDYLCPFTNILFSPQNYAISLSTVILPKGNAKLGGKSTPWASVRVLFIKQNKISENFGRKINRVERFGLD